MKYDITDKLKFDADPVIKVRDMEITINSDAENVLQILDILQNESEYAAMRKCMPILLDKENQEKLRSLKLKTGDYMEVLQVAVSLALGEDPDEENSGK